MYNKVIAVSECNDLFTIAFFHSIRESCIQFFNREEYKNVEENRIYFKKLDLLKDINSYISVLLSIFL